MSRIHRGFTIIELMIVVTIIAIIASIAIPNLLQARMASNETACIATLKAIATAQAQFRRLDHPFSTGTLGVYEYARPFTNLYALDTSGEVLVYVDKGTNDSHFTAGTGLPKAGYFFYDLLTIVPSGSLTSVALDYKLRYGITAVPSGYNLSGRNSYYRDDKGVAWQSDTGINPSSSATTFWEMHENPKIDGWVVTE